MRADRLLALLMLLQTRGKTTAARLAQELEVSERTLYRDVYALRVAGFPVSTTRGPEGGCSLEGGFRNRLTALKRDELAALFMGSIPAPLVQLGVAEDLKAALLKLSTAAGARSDSTAGKRVHLDSVPWSAAIESVEYLEVLHRAARHDRWVTVTFERVFGIRSVRRIAPYGLVAKAATWYVVWVGEDERFRVDRISRILSAELQEECFDRPTDFDLEEFWTGWCERQGRNEPRVKVVLRVSDDALPILRARLGGAMRAAAGVAHSGPRGHVIEAAFPSMEDARGQLLAFGGAVEVIEPQALRLTLVDFAEQAVYVYRNG